MASLTPLSKGLIALAVVGAMSSAVWHLGVKPWLAERDAAGRNGSASQSSASGIQKPFPQPDTVTEVQPAEIDIAQPAPRVPAPRDAPPATAGGGISPARMSAADNTEAGRRLLNSGDFGPARAHLEQAVKDGDGTAICLLGEMTLKGQGGAPDHEKAGALFRLAQSRNIICFASGG